MLDQHERTHRLTHRDLDFLALTGAGMVEESSGNRLCNHQPGDLVGDQRRHQHRRQPDALRQIDNSAGGLNDVVIGRCVGQGGIDGITRRRAVDQISAELA